MESVWVHYSPCNSCEDKKKPSVILIPFLELCCGLQLGCAVGVRCGGHVLRDGVQEGGAYGGTDDQNGQSEGGIVLEALLELVHGGFPFGWVLIIGAVILARQKKNERLRA